MFREKFQLHTRERQCAMTSAGDDREFLAPKAVIVVALALVLASFGCAGYRLGTVSGVPAGDRSVQVNPFVNQTVEPRLSDAATSQLRKQLQRDGTFRLASHEDGDIVVTGVLTRYQRHELSFARNDTLTVTDYRLALTAQVTARDRATGRVILDQPVSGYTLIRVGADLVSSERQALPLLAADLAKNVTALLVEGRW